MSDEEEKVHDCPYCECKPESKFVTSMKGCLTDLALMAITVLILFSFATCLAS